ncbi:DUF2878 domain-containing protein [Alteromonadaceae bacterium M269]|nr:DUF2878 domain-containing protein [Alteromonadaceae bacterium M269]
MRYLAANKLVNFAWFQSIWFLAILGQDKALPLLALLFIFHFSLIPKPLTELKIILFGISLGILVDGSMTYFGIFMFESESLLIPVWLIALWAGLSGTLRHSLNYFAGKPVLTALAGGIGAALSYIAGMKLGAVSFPLGITTTFLVIFICWSIVFPTLFHVSQRSRRSSIA